jgi:dipeptidase
MPCTTLLVGKDASYDGSTLIARDDDSGSGRYDPKRLVSVSPADQPRHYRSVLSHVEIDLPDDPCAYLMAPDALRNRGILAEAAISERNVAMSATETIAVNERVLGADPMVVLRPATTIAPNRQDYAVDQMWQSLGEPKPYNGSPSDRGLKAYLDSAETLNNVEDNASVNDDLLTQDITPAPSLPTDEIVGGIGEEDIITLILPYVHSAREGVQRLGMLLETYGTYEANGVSISDGSEVWYVETIGGHHWIARRVPDDCYATIPNQLGLDHFDLIEALSEPEAGQPDTRDYLCSADLREFIETNHLDRSMDTSEDHWHHLNPRTLFGTSTTRDHIYNTPRAWYMQRCLNPSDDWDSPAARYNPISDDIPWCRVPENKVTIEDINVVLSSHYEDTPYDPYGRQGTVETRHRYRPIGISRTGHLAIMQIRGYLPSSAESYRSLMWLAFGSQPFTANVPFYINVSRTPSYLRDTTGEVSTSTLYWTNRLIAAIADTHFDACSNIIDAFREDMFAQGHLFVAEADNLLGAAAQKASLQQNGAASAGGSYADNERYITATKPIMEAANQRTADYLEACNKQVLDKVLFIATERMNNAFALSDRPGSTPAV